jgi:hypothetical protein
MVLEQAQLQSDRFLPVSGRRDQRIQLLQLSESDDKGDKMFRASKSPQVTELLEVGGGIPKCSQTVRYGLVILAEAARQRIPDVLTLSNKLSYILVELSHRRWLSLC